LPPFTNTIFFSQETQNSNPKFIRSTLTSIPDDPSILIQSNLQLSLIIQPFSELYNQENEVVKVETEEGIFRCKRCSSYINSKYKIEYNKLNRKVCICNLCGSQNELDQGNPLTKQEYFTNTESSPELNIPTVDFFAPKNLQHQNKFEPHYIFMIDISNFSKELGFCSYIINSIQSSLDSIHNAENSYVGFGLFDSKSIKFLWYDRSDVKIAIVPDITRPFCPLPRNKIFLNVINQREEIDKIIERINLLLGEEIKKGIPPGSCSGASISAGIQSLYGNGGRVIIFNANSCVEGFGSSKIKDEKNISNPDYEKKLYNLQHQNFQDLITKCGIERIAVDIFSFANPQFDFVTMSQISIHTGGKASHYSINSKDEKDLNKKFEKIHYDLARILTRPNYYDVKFMIRYGVLFEVNEIIGQFGKKLGTGFTIPSFDPDQNFIYNLRYNERLKDPLVNFQVVCMYVDNFNHKYLRVFNLSLQVEKDISKIYLNVDVDSMTRAIINKELLQFYNPNIDKLSIKQNLITKIINILLFYRKKCSEKSPPQQLILPASVKFIPLFINSLFKKSLLRKNKDKISSNDIFSEVIKFMREPTKNIIKYLNPKFYRIDDILEDQSYKIEKEENSILINIGNPDENNGVITTPYSLPLSLDYIDFDCKYILLNKYF